MRRKRKDTGGDGPPGAALWLLTYGDLVTLCLTFFVLLYSFSTIDNQKWKNVITSLQGSLGVLEGGSGIHEHFPGSSQGIEGNEGSLSNDGTDGSFEESPASQIDRIDDYLRYQQEMKKLEALQEDLTGYLAEKGLSGSIVVAVEERGLVIRFQDSVLFEKSKADLIAQSRITLKEIAQILIATDNSIRIEGHTDDLPIHTERFPSNWELSTSRATNVLRFLIEEGMPAVRLSAVGYGEYHPLVPNNDEESRRKNRRVDIVILRESLQKNEPR